MAKACDGVEIAWDAKNPYFAKVYTRTADHIDSITKTTRADVMRVIQQGYDEGWSIPQVATEIRATIRGSSAGRATTIARTEMNRFQNGAALSAAQVVGQAAGVDYQKRWLTAPGAEHPRHEDYEGLDGQTVGLDEMFDVGGNEFQYPGDPDGDPGDSINCRCSIEFVEASGQVADVAVPDEMIAASAAGLSSDRMDKEEDNVDPETTVELADNMDQCANCDHYASAHAGDDNMGACSMDDCDCAGFEAAAAETEEATVTASTSGMTLTIVNGNPMFTNRDQPTLITFNGETYHGNLLPAVSAIEPQVFTLTPTFQNGWTNVENPHLDEEVKEVLEAAVEVELPAEHQPQDVQPEENASPPAPDVVQRTNAAEIPYHVILAPEGKATDDGRIFAPGSIGWRDLPLSLMAMTETPGEGGHAGAELCGKINSIYRDDSDKPTLIAGDGVFEDSDFGHDIADKVDQGFLTGNSVDLAVLGAKLCMRDDVVDEDGFWLDGLDVNDVPEVDVLALFFGEVDGPVLHVITDAKIGMSTVCPFPAFADATITLAADGRDQRWTIFQGVMPYLTTVHVDQSIRVLHKDDGLTASAAGMVPVVPPREWFNDPELDELTPLTVTDDGRVYGHAFPWGECHISFQSDCTIAPHTQTGYAYYMLKEVETDDGSTVECGTITLDTNHAGKHLGWKEAANHYDHTGTAIADVAFGEDEHGGWFSGALRPDASAEAVRKFRGASVSGDWRRIHGNLELVGLLSVNVAGFPIPRPRALVSSGDETSEILTLVAAGVIGRKESEPAPEITEADKQVLAAFASGEMNELAALAEGARD